MEIRIVNVGLTAILDTSTTFKQGEKMTLIKKKTEKKTYYSDLTKSAMVKVITEQTGLTLPALERATKIDIESIAKALKVNANYKGA